MKRRFIYRCRLCEQTFEEELFGEGASAIGLLLAAASGRCQGIPPTLAHPCSDETIGIGDLVGAVTN